MRETLSHRLFAHLTDYITIQIPHAHLCKKAKLESRIYLNKVDKSYRVKESAFTFFLLLLFLILLFKINSNTHIHIHEYIHTQKKHSLNFSYRYSHLPSLMYYPWKILWCLSRQNDDISLSHFSDQCALCIFDITQNTLPLFHLVLSLLSTK